MKEDVKRPSLFWLLTEAGRAFTELGASIPYRKFMTNNRHGDGHPVWVLPGFLASDTSTNQLRAFIKCLGYTPLAWELGRNFAQEDYIHQLIERLEEIHEEYQEPITIIGWSLGGIYARQVAKAQPSMVRQVITLGSPFRGVGEPNNVAWLYNLITGGQRVADVNPTLLEDIPLPAPVPTTAIYSKQDGVVPWQLCMEEEEDDWHQNIEVRGSHLGLGVNASVLRIIENRLLFEKSNWVPFKPNNFVEDLLFYPSI